MPGASAPRRTPPSRPPCSIRHPQAASSASTCPSSASRPCSGPPRPCAARPPTQSARTRWGRTAFRARAAAHCSGVARSSRQRASRGRTPRARARRRRTQAMRPPALVGGYTRRASRRCRRRAAARRTRATLVPASTARSTLAATSPVARTIAVVALPMRWRHRLSGPRRFRPRTGHLPMEPPASPTLPDNTTTESLRAPRLLTTPGRVWTSLYIMSAHHGTRLLQSRSPTLFTPQNPWICVSLDAIMLEHDACDVLYD